MFNGGHRWATGFNDAPMWVNGGPIEHQWWGNGALMAVQMWFKTTFAGGPMAGARRANGGPTPLEWGPNGAPTAGR
eukprot:1304392-Lingulodinium_polyedra.AAC.1